MYSRPRAFKFQIQFRPVMGIWLIRKYMNYLFAFLISLCVIFPHKGFSIGDEVHIPLTELHEYQSLRVFIDNQFNPIKYSIIRSGEGHYEEPVTKNQMGQKLGMKVGNVEHILKQLREMNTLLEEFPIKSYNSKRGMFERAKRLAVQFSDLISSQELSNMDRVEIGGENNYEPFKQFYRHRLIKIYQVVRDPFVLPYTRGYFQAAKSTWMEKQVREVFWQTLAKNLVNVAPNEFRTSEDKRFLKLSKIIDLVTYNKGMNEVFSKKSCGLAITIIP